MLLTTDVLKKISKEFGADFALNEVMTVLDLHKKDKELLMPVHQLTYVHGFAERIKKARQALKAVNLQIRKK